VQGIEFRQHIATNRNSLHSIMGRSFYGAWPAYLRNKERVINSLNITMMQTHMKLKSILAVVISSYVASATQAGEELIDFTGDVKPILASKCWNCHGPDANTRKGDLRLDVRDDAEYVLEADGDSLATILERIMSSDSDIRMPPAASKKPLTKKEIDVLTRWVDRGAPYEGHWAFRPPERSTPPEVRRVDAVRNPIDNFIIARLESANLTPSPEASRETLIRRLSLDLTGIPPTIAEVEEFVADTASNAYEKLIDRLLKSPRHGEHMAVQWLDAARYADTDGYQNDRYRYMHVWRDWVILALNDNKPYDDFLVEQIAGDMLPNATLKQQIATGFCRNHRIN